MKNLYITEIAPIERHDLMASRFLPKSVKSRRLPPSPASPNHGWSLRNTAQITGKAGSAG
jgi:hypothetical protein